MQHHSRHFNYQMRSTEHGEGLGGGRGARHGEGFPGRRGGGERGRGRIFSHGGLRFVLLHLIGEKPSHGYELIKLIEDRLDGSYSPSPGTVYPTLTLLEEQGYLQSESAEAGGRKSYAITDAGQVFLEENRALADTMLARMNGSVDNPGARGGKPPQVMRAVENLKLAMRLRLSGEALSPEQANAFAAVLDHAAQQLEQI
ncbi:MAG: PadR family transcriptional regulator [Rhodoferax ferrireducens]|uniref:PadR family transcriptional regulator n=1 Tax=Rhodoferax ferrireducens TaxID=192843 RepID=A0A1W9KXL9_9BURK|nr:MAG: PadR family transcriptional regulator [Rhodoferax ferrireducens]